MVFIKKLNIKALLIGSLIDIGGSFVFGMIWGIIVGIYFSMHGFSQEEINAKFMSTSMLIFSFLSGSIFTVLGGYIAGRIAKYHQLIHGCIVGIASMIYAVMFMSSLPIWFNTLGMLSTIPLSVLGGYFSAVWLKQNNA